jgi:hypothetical protein
MRSRAAGATLHSWSHPSSARSIRPARASRGSCRRRARSSRRPRTRRRRPAEGPPPAEAGRPGANRGVPQTESLRRSWPIKVRTSWSRTASTLRIDPLAVAAELALSRSVHHRSFSAGASTAFARLRSVSTVSSARVAQDDERACHDRRFGRRPLGERLREHWRVPEHVKGGLKRPEKADGRAPSTPPPVPSGYENCRFAALSRMARPGLEPGTPRFSVVEQNLSNRGGSLQIRTFSSYLDLGPVVAICVLSLSIWALDVASVPNQIAPSRHEPWRGRAENDTGE